MSDWEQYVESTAPLLDAGAFDRLDPHHEHWAMEQRRDIARRRARLVLEKAGPVIVADTQQRLVEAAARAVQRTPDERTKIVADLRYLAEAREDYCLRCPEHQGDMMQMDQTALGVHEGHATASWLADIIEGTNDGKGWLPSWRWDEWEARP